MESVLWMVAIGAAGMGVVLVLVMRAPTREGRHSSNVASHRARMPAVPTWESEPDIMLGDAKVTGVESFDDCEVVTATVKIWRNSNVYEGVSLIRDPANELWYRTSDGKQFDIFWGGSRRLEMALREYKAREFVAGRRSRLNAPAPQRTCGYCKSCYEGDRCSTCGAPFEKAGMQ